jgi:salicylate hydroxylase
VTRRTRSRAAADCERQPRVGKLAKMETSNRDAETAGPIAARMREMIMPHVFNRFYEKATGWLCCFDPGTLPVTQGLTHRSRKSG